MAWELPGAGQGLSSPPGKTRLQELEGHNLHITSHTTSKTTRKGERPAGEGRCPPSTQSARLDATPGSASDSSSCSSWLSAAHMGDLHGVPGSWIWPQPGSVVGIWGVGQWMRALYLQQICFKFKKKVKAMLQRSCDQDLTEMSSERDAQGLAT